MRRLRPIDLAFIVFCFTLALLGPIGSVLGVVR